MQLDIATKIAREVRLKCEEYARRLGNRYFTKSLESMCGIASYALKQALEGARLDSNLVYGFYDGMGHCWLEYGDRIIDITATQFGVRRRVYVTDYENAKYQFEKYMGSIAEFEMDGWLEGSYPTERVINAILFST